jgi:hypothetical protein
MKFFEPDRPREERLHPVELIFLAAIIVMLIVALLGLSLK